VDWGSVISLSIAALGLGGLLFTALRFRRDDTTAIVSQQDTLFNEMRALNDELRQENDRLTKQVEALRREHTR